MAVLVFGMDKSKKKYWFVCKKIKKGTMLGFSTTLNHLRKYIFHTIYTTNWTFFELMSSGRAILATKKNNLQV